MKKLLTILFIFALLVGCSKTKITWDDVKADYDAVINDVAKISENSKTFYKDDYLNALDELKDLVSNLDNNTEENKTNLLKICKLAHSMSNVASTFEEDSAKMIVELSYNVDELIQSAYEEDENKFTENKDETLSLIETIEEFSDDDWAKIEKKITLTWSEVKGQYEIVEAEAKLNMSDYKEVSEYELDDLKSTIIANYETIKYGVTDYTNDYAKEIYDAAYRLEIYASKAKCEEGNTVYEFASNAKKYVRMCYGDNSDILDHDFALDIESAKKWTQSLWNVITMNLKMN